MTKEKAQIIMKAYYDLEASERNLERLNKCKGDFISINAVDLYYWDAPEIQEIFKRHKEEIEAEIINFLTSQLNEREQKLKQL